VRAGPLIVCPPTKPEALFRDQFHVKVFCFVAHVRGQPRKQCKFQALPACLLYSRKKHGLLDIERRKVDHHCGPAISCLQDAIERAILDRFGCLDC